MKKKPTDKMKYESWASACAANTLREKIYSVRKDPEWANRTDEIEALEYIETELRLKSERLK